MLTSLFLTVASISLISLLLFNTCSIAWCPGALGLARALSATSVYRRRVAMWLAIGINMCWILARSCEEGALPASFIAWSSFFLADSLKSPEALSLESVPVWVVYQAHVTTH